MSAEPWKRLAAERALTFLKSGMTVGLGSGSTAAAFVVLVGGNVRQGFELTCVATSQATLAQAQSLGIALTTLDRVPFLDLTVDGTDELDDQLRLKGGGGALLRENIVATVSERMVVIADTLQRVARLGKFPLPVEVARFRLAATRNMLSALSAEVGCDGEIRLRTDGGQPLVTDNGNYILDCAFGRIDDPEALDAALKRVPGVLENGLFLGIADAAVIAGPDGVVVIERDIECDPAQALGGRTQQ